MIVLSGDLHIGFQREDLYYTFQHWNKYRNRHKYEPYCRPLEKMYAPIAPTIFVRWSDED
jgi:hypothetical protein